MPRKDALCHVTYVIPHMVHFKALVRTMSMVICQDTLHTTRQAMRHTTRLAAFHATTYKTSTSQLASASDIYLEAA